jgi:hypothetical protein
MTEQLNKEQAYAEELGKKQAEHHKLAMRSKQSFVQAGRDAAAKNNELSGAQRAAKAASQLQATKKALAASRKVRQEAAPEEEEKDTGMWVVIFILSILADFFTLIPIAGTFFSIFFSVGIWFVYAVNGYFNKNFGAKLATMGTTSIMELLPIIDALPFYTASAFINYTWLSVKKTG